MDQDDFEQLQQYCDKLKTRFEHKTKLRELNSHDNIDYVTESAHTNKLEASIKKNAAFAKRLKAFGDNLSKDQILEEIDRLDLTKFVSEVTTSLIEAKIKLSDIPAVIEICTKLNRSYKDFQKHLLEQYSRYFPVAKQRFNKAAQLQCINDAPSPVALQVNNSSNQNHTISNSHRSSSPSTTHSTTQATLSTFNTTNLVRCVNRNVSENFNPAISPTKLRVDLRLFFELIISGVLPVKEALPILVNLLCYLMVDDKNVYHNANAILTFCKSGGEDFLGLAPARMKQLAQQNNIELPTSMLISAKRQSLFLCHIRDYYHNLGRYLLNLHGELERMLAKNTRVQKCKGEISRDSRELIDKKCQEYYKLQNIANQLADLLSEDTIQLPSLDGLELSPKLDVQPLMNQEEFSTSVSSIWDDEDTRGFYENFVDFKALLPNLQYKSKKTDKQKQTDLDESGDSPDGSASKTVSSSSSEESLVESDAKTIHHKWNAKSRSQPEQFFAKLADCVNRDMIDNAAVDFIKSYNTKFGRRKLLKTLFNVQRTRLDLLPFFARLTATIYQEVPSVGNELVSMLKLDFKHLFNKKDQINIESKVKNVRFIGELVKFNLFPKQEALNCLKMLLSDFTHHHIEMTCNLLETCGRLLYKTPETHHQSRLILEQMMRKKLLLSVDSKYVTMIENAYYFTNPTEIARQVVEEPPVYLYIRYMLYELLNRSTIDKVLQKLKMIDWNDTTLTKYIIHCMVEAFNVKFYNIRYLAALLAALNKEQPWIAICVIDGVVEDILLMMEINEIQFNQRRIPMIRFFGELYNYRLSDSSLVFKILYSLITYGTVYPQPNQTLNQIPLSHLDPPENLFRIKLVCDLLDTCGQYLSGCQEKRKLDCYLLYFQRYYWCKKHIYMLLPCCMAKSGNQFPASMDYLYNDTIQNLRPNFKMECSYAGAVNVLQKFFDNLK